MAIYPGYVTCGGGVKKELTKVTSLKESVVQWLLSVSE